MDCRNMRKYNYKPQFYQPEEKIIDTTGNYNKEKFKKKLKNSWGDKRKVRNNRNSMRNVIWIAFILLLLLFLVRKFVL
ncbi:MAG: hypothetical protein LBI45_06235 [Bacteroidales bacterium]|nr:hypothetical protein [Bacteroidales bacterium]